MISMLKKLTFLLLVGIFLCISGCGFEEAQMGYPESVTFFAEGGEQIFTGDRTFTHILIGDGIEEYGSETLNDNIVVKHKWLTVYSPVGSNELVLSAQPSNETNKRELIVYGYSGREYATIKVIQKE